MKDQTSLLRTGSMARVTEASGEASVDYLRLLLDNTYEIVLVLDKELNITLFNKPAEAYIRTWVGVTVSKGQHLSKIVPSSICENVVAAYKSVLSGGEKIFEEEVKKEEGHLIFASSIKPAYNAAGQIMGVISITRDITLQREKEQALKAFEERWQFALEKSNHGLWEWDMVADTVTYSESYKSLFGFNQAELTPSLNEWQSRIHPEDVPMVEEAVERHKHSTDPFFESVYRLQDITGKYRWILARGMIISRNKEGEPLYMIGSHTDITTQKEAEEQYKKLFFNHPIPMWIYDPTTLRIREVNDAAISFYGYSRAEFLSFKLYDLRLPEEQSDLDEVISQLVPNKIISSSKGNLDDSFQWLILQPAFYPNKN
jgi:PAS domain S-box-containing protein